ncbi:MAG: hypothetical protein KAR13_21495, partial [Desulfobulbaceae bacterium]|nr:hypothetical protein [Desulfobulbaceae bacterium]
SIYLPHFLEIEKARIMCFINVLQTILWGFLPKCLITPAVVFRHSQPSQKKNQHIHDCDNIALSTRRYTLCSSCLGDAPYGRLCRGIGSGLLIACKKYLFFQVWIFDISYFYSKVESHALWRGQSSTALPVEQTQLTSYSFARLSSQFYTKE